MPGTRRIASGNTRWELAIMSQVVTATFVNGVLKPAQELDLASGTKVRLIVDVWDDVRGEHENACAELDRLCDEFPIESQRGRLTRDELHDRR
jgi:predicted DNA-binding antitoxin AbrB/MazE fold protein